jgi:hypothetical protein
VVKIEGLEKRLASQLNNPNRILLLPSRRWDRIGFRGAEVGIGLAEVGQRGGRAATRRRNDSAENQKRLEQKLSQAQRNIIEMQAVHAAQVQRLEQEVRALTSQRDRLEGPRFKS